MDKSHCVKTGMSILFNDLSAMKFPQSQYTGMVISRLEAIEVVTCEADLNVMPKVALLPPMRYTKVGRWRN